ncbi:MAG: YicC family protein [Ruminococcaceae bacterium]|nr:YicC family protein [Oscillospiraceae bacterium]
MIKSMTSFGRARSTVGGKDITVELKSVNNRFFDCSVKLPRAFSFLEEKIKPHLQSKSISRGKVDVYVTINVIDTPDVSFDIDEGYASAYISALQKLGDKFGLTNDVSIMNVAKNPDIFVIKKSEDDAERDWADLAVVLDEAIEKFLAARVREGENIRRDLCKKVEAIKARVDEIEKISLSDTSSYREKLEARLREMLSDNRIVFDENRILTECAIFADKIAIDEELVRLRSHFDGFATILESDEPAGRKLDFLVQEINRETNTIGSKCQNSTIAHLVVDIKCDIEKIREQIQNIE